MKRLYETKISNCRWIAYDLPGNAGWIAYITALILCFTKTTEFMYDRIMLVTVSAEIFPAILMITGIIELICERIKKQDRILPKWQLLLGFGTLTFGGCLGAAIALAGMIYGKLKNISDLTLIHILFLSAALCALFAGLLYKGYNPKEDL